MKYVQITNTSSKRIAITQVRGLVLNPGEARMVHPSTAKHPVVSRYISSGNLSVTGEVSKEEPAKPKKAVTAPVETTPVQPEPTPEPESQPIATPVPEPEKTVVENDEDLRALYVSAPGVTDENVDAILGIYATVEDLKDASKDDLVELGVSKSYAKRLIDWASEQ
jgi:hypothetical protein